MPGDRDMAGLCHVPVPRHPQTSKVNPKRENMRELNVKPFKYIQNMKKAIDFAICALWVLGTIGGIGYALYEGAYPIAAGVAALSIMSFPTVKKHFNELTE